MANRIFNGSAPDVQQVSTITFTLTWATADTVTLTCGSVSLTLTVGAIATVTGVAAAVVAMINGDDLVGDETRDRIGSDYGEWVNITATSAAGVVTLTADQDNNGDSEPFTVTETVVTAGDGDAAVALVTASAGRYHVDDIANFGAALPGASDVLILEGPNMHARYGWDNATIKATALTHYATFTGDVGLPPRNTRNQGKHYDEYRQQTASIGLTKNIHVGLGDGSGMVRVDGNATVAACHVFGSGPRKYGFPSVTISNMATALLRIRAKCDVGVDWFPSDTASSALTVRTRDSDVYFANSTTSLAAILVTDGTVTTQGTLTGLTQDGGVVVSMGNSTGTAQLNGGRLDFRGTTLAGAVFAGGQLDLSNSVQLQVTGADSYEAYWNGDKPYLPINDPLGILAPNAAADYNVNCNNFPTSLLKLNAGRNKGVKIGGTE